MSKGLGRIERLILDTLQHSFTGWSTFALARHIHGDQPPEHVQQSVRRALLSLERKRLLNRRTIMASGMPVIQWHAHERHLDWFGNTSCPGCLALRRQHDEDVRG
jgi:hypothetical protein